MKINKSFSINKFVLVLFLIVLLGAFLRLYQLPERFEYAYDHELISWIVRDIVVNKHLRLIGQLTSTPGVYIGPLYYYLAIPFYLISNLDPIVLPYYASLWGVFGIISFYFVFSRIWNKRIGVIAALIISVEFYIVSNDRWAVPTQPVIAWTVWYLYGLNLLLKGEHKKGLIVCAVLAGLIWHLNFALILLMPLVPVALFLSHRKIYIKELVISFVAFVTVSIPFFLFEFRHQFLQTKSILFSLSVNQKDTVYVGINKFLRVIFLLNKDLTNASWGTFSSWGYSYITSLIFLTLFIFLVWKKSIDKNLAILVSLWLILYIGFFSSYSKIVSEYYLDGILVLAFVVLTLGFDYLISRKKLSVIGFVLLGLFSLVNIYRFFVNPINKSGYVERKDIVLDIKNDMQRHNFACSSISYITSPGNDLGYRYFLWLEGVKTKEIKTGVPVYSIVYPQKPYFKTDKNFGAIGIIYPDYLKYKGMDIEKLCSGENYNLTYPIFGYTQ